MRRILTLMTSAVALCASPVWADVLTCTTRVTEIDVTPSGSVLATFSGSGTPNMCSLNMTITGPGVGSISPDVCRGWLSMFLTARAAQLPVTFKIDYGTSSAPSSCANLANFNYQIPNPFPYYVSVAPAS